MVYFIIGLCLALVLEGILVYWAKDGGSFLAFVLAAVLGIGCLIGVISLTVLGFDYKAAEYKTAIINREYKTEYTRDEVFYGHDVIDTIRQLDRKRVELNGDILEGK
jgi:hypothetical protein